jgi:1,4-dihydroxy-2-naphthoyl-CoA hydrolase
MDPFDLDDMNASGFNAMLGIKVDGYDDGRVTGHIMIDERHHQPFGQVHGGVWCAIVESFGSIGGAIAAHESGKIVVGVTNTTDFLRGVRAGRIDIEASALHVGRMQHLWQVSMTREDGKLVARGQVRLQVLEPRAGA